jgi:beta-galactosidase
MSSLISVKTILVALAVALALPLFARELTPLNDGWKFVQGAATNAAATSLDDSSWTNLSLPHCWGWELAQRGEKYLRASGWYRRELKIQQQPGRRYFVRFEAAGSVADVFLNGKKLGEHRGAFGAFCFELTKHLATNGVNTLAVRVSNEAQPDVAPLSGDFPVYGGLYRGAALLETAEVCFTPTDHASPGVAWLQTSVSSTQAVLDVTSWISNPAKKSRALTLVASVVDAGGKIIQRVTNAITVVSN